MMSPALTAVMHEVKRGRVGQVFEGRGRSLLLSSSRNEARLWDVGACSDRAGGAWTPAEYVTEPLHTCAGMRNAIFRPDGRMVRCAPPPHSLMPVGVPMEDCLNPRLRQLFGAPLASHCTEIS